jgi:hypothetical protein
MTGPSARAMWQDKLEFLLAEEATATDAAQKFKLQHDITEARAKLRELDKAAARLVSHARPPHSAPTAIAVSHLPADPDRAGGVRGGARTPGGAAWANPSTHVMSLIA